MIKKRFIGVAVIGALAGMVANFPLSWVGNFFPQDNLANPLRFTGTVWKGQVLGLPLTGPLEINTQASKLMGSGAPVSFKSHAPGISLSGDAGLQRIENLIYRAEFDALPITDGRLVGLSGMIDLTINEMKFAENCETASGHIRTDVLQRNSARFQWQGPELSGPINCEYGEIIATLSGRDNRTYIEAVARINLSGNYRLETSVSSRDPEAAALLPLYGFQKNGDRFTLTEQGQW